MSEKAKTILMSVLAAAVVAVVVAAGLGGETIVERITERVPSGEQRAGSIKTVPDVYPNGVGIGQVSWSKGTVNYVGGKIERGQDQSVWTNKTGRDVYVDLGVMSLVPDSGGDVVSASSSYYLYMFATSTNSVVGSHLYTAISATTSELIPQVSIATSSPATTTNSYIQGNRVVLVPNDWSLIGLLQSQTCTGAASGGTCEIASSSFRDFDVEWFARLFY